MAGGFQLYRHPFEEYMAKRLGELDGRGLMFHDYGGSRYLPTDAHNNYIGKYDARRGFTPDYHMTLGADVNDVNPRHNFNKTVSQAAGANRSTAGIAVSGHSPQPLTGGQIDNLTRAAMAAQRAGVPTTRHGVMPNRQNNEAKWLDDINQRARSYIQSENEIDDLATYGMENRTPQGGAGGFAPETAVASRTPPPPPARAPQMQQPNFADIGQSIPVDIPQPTPPLPSQMPITPPRPQIARAPGSGRPPIPGDAIAQATPPGMGSIAPPAPNTSVASAFSGPQIAPPMPNPSVAGPPPVLSQRSADPKGAFSGGGGTTALSARPTAGTGGITGTDAPFAPPEIAAAAKANTAQPNAVANAPVNQLQPSMMPQEIAAADAFKGGPIQNVKTPQSSPPEVKAATQAATPAAPSVEPQKAQGGFDRVASSQPITPPNVQSTGNAPPGIEPVGPQPTSPAGASEVAPVPGKTVPPVTPQPASPVGPSPSAPVTPPTVNSAPTAPPPGNPGGGFAMADAGPAVPPGISIGSMPTPGPMPTPAAPTPAPPPPVAPPTVAAAPPVAVAPPPVVPPPPPVPALAGAAGGGLGGLGGFGGGGGMGGLGGALGGIASAIGAAEQKKSAEEAKKVAEKHQGATQAGLEMIRKWASDPRNLSFWA